MIRDLTGSKTILARNLTLDDGRIRPKHAELKYDIHLSQKYKLHSGGNALVYTSICINATACMCTLLLHENDPPSPNLSKMRYCLSQLALSHVTVLKTGNKRYILLSCVNKPT